MFRNSGTLKELGYRIMAGKIVWNQHRDKLTDNPREGILLIWTHNIRHGRLVLGNSKKKPPYIKWPIEKADRGPAIVITRVTGYSKRAVLRAALVPPDTMFVAENHVNVFYPPPNAAIGEMKEIVRQPNSERINRVIREITVNT